MHTETIAYYDRNAATLSARYDSADMGQVYRQISQLLPSGGTILEIGCGSGRDARKLSEMGFSVTACDASIGMVCVARDIESASRVKYVCKAFPLQDNDPLLSCRFDMILSIAMIMHLPCQELPVFIRQAAAMMKDDGFLVLSWCNRDSEQERLYEAIDIEHLISMLENNSLEVMQHMTTSDSLGRSILWHFVTAKMTCGSRDLITSEQVVRTKQCDDDNML